MQASQRQRQSAAALEGGQYEFRAWGPRDDAYAFLARSADRVCSEELEDWYLSIGGPSCNAKIRRDRLKIKRLVGEAEGFQCWSSSRRPIMGDGIDPLAVLADELGFDPAPPSTGGLDGPSPIPGVELIHVLKWRQRFDLGEVRAEVAEMAVNGCAGRHLSVAIEGRDLDELVRLRSLLGLGDSPNVAVHVAIRRSWDGVVPTSTPPGPTMSEPSDLVDADRAALDIAPGRGLGQDQGPQSVLATGFGE
jgi:hypothetical protein